MWHLNVPTSLAEALTAHEDSGWRTRVLVFTARHFFLWRLLVRMIGLQGIKVEG